MYEGAPAEKHKRIKAIVILNRGCSQEEITEVLFSMKEQSGVGSVFSGVMASMFF